MYYKLPNQIWPEIMKSTILSKPSFSHTLLKMWNYAQGVHLPNNNGKWVGLGWDCFVSRQLLFPNLWLWNVVGCSALRCHLVPGAGASSAWLSYAQSSHLHQPSWALSPHGLGVHIARPMVRSRCTRQPVLFLVSWHLETGTTQTVEAMHHNFWWPDPTILQAFVQKIQALTSNWNTRVQGNLTFSSPSKPTDFDG